MPNTKEYDDQLVQLLGRGELSDEQIAERLGISPSQVRRIARGENRPDLQPKINAAMRQTLKVAWKNGGRLDTESGQPLPPGAAKTSYDRYLAAELIGSGQYSLSQIARRLGVHKNTAWRISAGHSHPELQPLIREAQQRYQDQARRLGSKWNVQIVTKQIKVGLEDNGWVGLRARQDLLDRFLDPEADAAAARRFGPEHVEGRYESRPFSSDLEKLPKPLRNKVIEALGGPGGDDDPYGDAHWSEPETWKAAGAPAQKDKRGNTAKSPGKQESRCESGRDPPGG